ncbi:MAG: hypothetical protein P4L45_04530 [Ignavibacteriaceae bacterium]|nr:hypothetical protein [Ignavibacteriaceae bacterium]
MRNLIRVLFLLCTLAFELCTCEGCKSPTAPKDNKHPDTTSNSFVWSVDTIGAEGSVLYDVTIINDTLAYASGSIYLRDSTGKSDLAHPYNFILWNGKNWTYYTLRYFPPGSTGDSAYGPGTCVFAKSSNDIWISAVVPFHFDGLRWQAFYNTGADAANKIWEDSDGKQIYFVGNNGLITYTSDKGNTWQNVETGTTLPFQDIWGDNGQVLAIASSHNYAARQLYSLQGNTATAISDSGLYYVFGGIWFVANTKYYLAGDGIFEKSSLQSPSWYRHPVGEIASYYSNAIRGSGINDIVITGSYGDISHFNGKTWIEYKQLINTNDRLLSISIKDNIIIAAGYRYIDYVHNYGVIYLGRR